MLLTLNVLNIKSLNVFYFLQTETKTEKNLIAENNLINRKRDRKWNKER